MSRSLDDIMSSEDADASPQTNPTTPPEATEQDNRSRDERGRFASKDQSGEAQEPQQEVVAEPAPAQVPEGYVPQQALHAARQSAGEWKDKYGELERRMQVMETWAQAPAPQPQPAQPAPQPPSFFDDPEGFVKHSIREAIGPLTQRHSHQTEALSRMMAAEKFGADTVAHAEREFEQWAASSGADGYHEWQKLMASPHPYAALMTWRQNQQALQKYGADPEAFIKAEVERRIAEMQQPAPAQGQLPTQQTRLPQSFADARSAGPRTQPYAGPRPLSEIMGGR